MVETTERMLFDGSGVDGGADGKAREAVGEGLAGAGIEGEDAVPLGEEVGAVFQKIGGDTGSGGAGEGGKCLAGIAGAGAGGAAGEDIEGVFGGGEFGLGGGDEGAGGIELALLLEEIDAGGNALADAELDEFEEGFVGLDLGAEDVEAGALLEGEETGFRDGGGE